VAERLRFEALLSDLAAGLINLEPERVDQAIEDCLRRIVGALDLDRSTLAQHSGDDLVITHSWAVPGQDRSPRLWGRTDLPWKFGRITAGASVVFSRPADLPAEAVIDKAMFQRLGPRSNATMPLIVGGKIIGALGFGTLRRERTWTPAVLARLHNLASAVRDAMDYQIGVTDVQTAAADALERGAGVCQDHAHVFIATARLLGIPARYVGGYLWTGPESRDYDASHAWAEAYVPDRGWVGFDPANRICPTASYIRASVGLDYWSAAPVRGVRKGTSTETMAVKVTVGVGDQ